MTRHTPGPWLVGQYTPSKDFLKIKNHSCVCRPDMSLIALTGPADDRQSQKDGDLISAAPELLAALEQALRYIEVVTAYSNTMTAEQVEKAIKSEFAPSYVEIGAHSANTLASFDFVKARAAIAKAKGESNG